MKKRLCAVLLAVICVFMTACGGVAYTPGTFTDAGYETEFLGFRFNTPDGFALATTEELEQLMGISMDSLTESGDVTEVQAKYAQLTSIYELMVTDSMGVANANIILEKTVLPLNSYIEVLKEQLQTISTMSVTFTGEPAQHIQGYRQMWNQAEFPCIRIIILEK